VPQPRGCARLRPTDRPPTWRIASADEPSCRASERAADQTAVGEPVQAAMNSGRLQQLQRDAADNSAWPGPDGTVTAIGTISIHVNRLCDRQRSAVIVMAKSRRLLLLLLSSMTFKVAAAVLRRPADSSGRTNDVCIIDDDAIVRSASETSTDQRRPTGCGRWGRGAGCRRVRGITITTRDQRMHRSVSDHATKPCAALLTAECHHHRRRHHHHRPLITRNAMEKQIQMQMKQNRNAHV